MPSKTLTIPAKWLYKVALATGIAENELETMVIRMWDKGYTRAEIENTMALLARAKGNTVVFTRKGGSN